MLIRMSKIGQLHLTLFPTALELNLSSYLHILLQIKVSYIEFVILLLYYTNTVDHGQHPCQFN